MIRRRFGLFMVLCVLLMHTSMSFSLFGLGNTKSKDEQFLEWFTRNGGIATGVGVKDFSDFGRGVLAVNDVLEGTEVLHIPKKLIFCRESLKNSADPLHASFVDEMKFEETSIIAVLLLEMYRGKESLFYEYIQMLPSYVPNLQQFSRASLEQLQAPILHHQVTMAQKGFQKDYAHLVKVFKKTKLWPGPRSTIPTFDQYMWGASIIDSRGLRFQGEIHLAPFSDFFNYKPHHAKRDHAAGNFFLSHHVMKRSEFAENGMVSKPGYLSIIADRNATAGSQLYEDYGDNKDKIYLQYHGFVADENPFRCFDMPLPPLVPVKDLKGKKREVEDFTLTNLPPIADNTLRLLKALKFLQAPDVCVMADGKLELGAVVYTSVLGMSTAELDNCQSFVDTLDMSDRMTSDHWQAIGDRCAFHVLYKEYQKAISNPAELANVPQERSQEIRPFERLIQNFRLYFQTALSSYPTTIEFDEALLSDWIGGAVGANGHGSDNNPREQEHNLSALRFRLKHKKLLSDVLDLYTRGRGGDRDGDGASISASGEVQGGGDAADLDVERTIKEEEDMIFNAAGSTDDSSLEQPILSSSSSSPDTAAELSVGEMPIDVSANEADMSLEQQLERFNSWFAASAAATAQSDPDTPVKNKLSAQFIPGWRIGTVATADISDREVYLSVPTSVIMDSNTARNHSELKELFKRIMEVYGLEAKDDFHELLFLLIFEMGVHGKQSPYWPYLSLLPTLKDQLMVPTHWSSEELQTRLGPSHVIGQVVEYRQRQQKTFDSIRALLPVKTFFEELQKKISEQRGGNAAASASATAPLLRWESYVWAQTILDSRSIWWDGSRHLVPMLDFINCVEGPDPQRVHKTDMDASGKYATTAASWAFKQGEQVFENYGQANYIYFMYHGFALPIGQNVHDCVQHDIYFEEKDRKAIDMTSTTAQQIATQLGLNRRSSVGVCLAVEGAVFDKNAKTGGLPKDLWLALALKQNNVKQLRSRKQLGLPNAGAMIFLRDDLDKRVKQYTEHLLVQETQESAGGDGGGLSAIDRTAHFFLRTELHHLRAVSQWLGGQIEEARANGDAGADADAGASAGAGVSGGEL